MPWSPHSIKGPMASWNWQLQSCETSSRRKNLALIPGAHYPQRKGKRPASKAFLPGLQQTRACLPRNLLQPPRRQKVRIPCSGHRPWRTARPAQRQRCRRTARCNWPFRRPRQRAMAAFHRAATLTPPPPTAATGRESWTATYRRPSKISPHLRQRLALIRLPLRPVPAPALRAPVPNATDLLPLPNLSPSGWQHRLALRCSRLLASRVRLPLRLT